MATVAACGLVADLEVRTERRRPVNAFRGDRFRQRRLECGLTQHALADIMGSSINQLWTWEHGQIDPRSDSLVRMADALGVSTDWLLGRVDTPEGAGE
jgi:transcriptional regulator with XRE-family HTH domain